MRLSNRSTDRSSVIDLSVTDPAVDDLERDDPERGSAALEFIIVGLILLVPLVYLIVSLGLIQSQSLGVESGARHIARAVATSSDAGSARDIAARVLDTVVDEYGIDPGSVQLEMACVPAGVDVPAGRRDTDRHRADQGGASARAAHPRSRTSRRHCGGGVFRPEGFALLGCGVRRLRVALRRGGGDDDEGSVLLLTLGYAVLAMAVILVCVDATSLYLSQKRLDALADAAALAGGDGFTLTAVDDEPFATLTDAAIHDQAAAIVAQVGDGATLVAAGTPDGVSARVTVAGAWHPPVLTLFVPDGVALQATATSRTALR